MTNDPKKTLFNFIKERKNQTESEPYVLFLGAGASLSSGSPSMLQIVEETINNYSVRSFSSFKDENELFEEFTAIVVNFQDSDRYWLVARLFSNTNRSSGYFALAHLIKAGYFKIILTTNFDNYLETSLQEVGLTYPNDFNVIIIGKDKDEQIKQQHRNSRPSVKIFKLHGDLVSRIFKFTPEETYKFSAVVKECIREYLRKDLIMVGYRIQDRDIGSSLRCSDATLWYVNPILPDPAIKNSLGKREIKPIDGENGKFDKFFMDLFTFLITSKSSSNTTDKYQVVNEIIEFTKQTQSFYNALQDISKKIDLVYEIMINQFYYFSQTLPKIADERFSPKFSISSDQVIQLAGKEMRLKQIFRECNLYKPSGIPKSLLIEKETLQKDIYQLKSHLMQKNNGGEHGNE